MPITVKLSRKFYDTFGEDVVNELVEWFNVIDSTYRDEIRELNDLNHDRLRAEMGQLRAEFAIFRSDMRREMERLRAELIKWMFIFWATTALGVLGLTLRLH